MERLIFDAHAHYDDEKFDNDRDEVLGSLPEKGVFGVINSGTDYKTSLQSIEFAEKYPYIYAAVGIHPNSVTDIDKNDIDKEVEKIAELLQHKKVVAIGETGLDYYWDLPKEEQHIVFEKQLILSKETGFPIVIHDREAHGDVLEYLKKYRPKALVHCYSGSAEMLKEILRLGDICISLGGVVTFKNARVSVEVAKEVPMNRLMLETDAPYLAPVPFRSKRCDSSMILNTAERIAEIRGMSVNDVLSYTKDNVISFFDL
ncbi:MAG: TatD family hydrolase [Clostridia bacterium]|nr:TatD family hydrolase [Clostridia bacterium]